MPKFWLNILNFDADYPRQEKSGGGGQDFMRSFMDRSAKGLLGTPQV